MTRPFAIVVLLGAFSGVRAQHMSATLAGTVRSEGGGVEGAVVQARNAETGAVRTTVSDERGRYRLEPLSPGRWIVVARMAGGRLSEPSTVVLRLQQTVRLDFSVRGEASETVVVRAERPLVDRSSPAGQLRLGSGEVSALPLNGRAFTDLAVLDSSVRQAAPGNFYGERGSVFVINGQSGRSNTFLVDGLDNNDQTSGTSLNSFLSQQVIQEFVLMTHQFAPEFGRAAGGVLNVVTKRGGNERSFSAFLQGTSSDWNESGDFVDGLSDGSASRKAVGRFATGLTLSGPLRRDKAFYFIAYEHQQSNDIVPYTGVEREGFLEPDPVLRRAGGVVTAPADDDNLFVRFDFNASPRDLFMLRMSADDRSAEGVNVGGVMTPEAGFGLDERDLQLAAGWTRILSAGLISETRLLVSHSGLDQRANSSRTGVSRPSGVFGGNVLNRQDRDEDVVQLVENVTWHQGSHTLKFGLDLLRSHTRIAARFNPSGSFIYNYDEPFEPGDCGDIGAGDVEDARDADTYPLVDTPCTRFNRQNGIDADGDGIAGEPANILTYPVVFTRVVDPDTGEAAQPVELLDDLRIGLFAQDRWRAGRRWTLDYGLRYDLTTYELPGGIGIDSSIPNGGARRDTDNVAPRFGFTFTPKPDGDTVIRGGAGLFYDKLVLAFPAVSAVTSGTTIEFTFPQGLTCEVTERVVEGEIDSPCEFETFFFEPFTLRFSTGTDLETPYTVQYTLGMERRVGRFGVLRADAIRAVGHDLPLMLDLNPVICVPDDDETNPDCPLLPEHRDPTTGSIAAIVSKGRSWYTGLDLSYRWSRDTNWFAAGYTWSDAEDFGFDPLKGGITLPPDSRDLSAERGRSDGHRDHRLVLSGDFPLGWLGFRASGVAQFATGIPFNVTTGQDDNLDGILTDRPEGVGRNRGEQSSIAAINAIREEANDLLLDLDPVVSLDEPNFSQIDLRIYRPFGYGDGRGQGEFFVQVFNVFDRENEGLIEGRAISQNFGRAISLAGPPRTVELGLKLSY